MSSFFSALLAFFQAYGYPALWMIVFIAAVGAPLPIDLLLGAAGAFAALGDLNVCWLAVVTISASVCGDNLGYLVGRRWGSQALARLAHSRVGKHLFPPRTILAARTYFDHYGGWAVFLSRFLFSLFGGVLNLLAGSQCFSYRTFLWCDIAGETVGAVLSLALGWVFGASWEAAGNVLNAFSLFVLSLLIIIILLVRLVHPPRLSRHREHPEETSANSPSQGASVADTEQVNSDITKPEESPSR